MDCGSIGCGFNSPLLPLFLLNNIFYKFLKHYSITAFNISLIKQIYILSFFKKFIFLNSYYRLNDLIWQEGLLIDFLQKKTIDLWIKKFLIYSSYLFNERFVFEKITRFFLDLLIVPMHKIFFFEINSVTNLLFINIFMFVFIFICFLFLFICL